MAIIAEWRTFEEKCVVPALVEAAEKLVVAKDEVVLDFVSVRRIDANALRVMAELAGKAEEKAVKIVLRGVNVDLYKVLKLMKLASRFSYSSCDGERAATKMEDSHAEPSAK